MSRTYRTPELHWENIEEYERSQKAYYYTYSGRWWRLRYNRSEQHEYVFSVKDAHDYFKNFRDGYTNETGRNQGYKDDTNAIIRHKTRMMISNIKKDLELYEESQFPTKKDGKFLKWVYW